MKYTKKNILSKFIKKHIGLFLSTFFFGILSNIIIILIPISIGKYYDLLFDYHSTRARILDSLPANWFNDIHHFFIFFFIIVLLRIGFNLLQRYYTAKLGELFVKETRENLFAHQLKIDPLIYEQKGIGRYLLRFSGDLNSIKGYLTVGILRFSIDLFLLLLTLGVMLWLNPLISLILLIGIITTQITVYFLNKWLYNRSYLVRNKKSMLLAFVNKNLLAIFSIKALNRYSVSEKRFNAQSEKVYQSGLKFQLANNLIIAIIPGLLYLSLGAILISIYYIKTNNISSFSENELLAFILLFITILPVVRRTLRVSSRWKIGGLSFSKLLKIFNLPVEHGIEIEDEIQLTSDHIQFNKVFFSKNEGDDLIFENLCFEIGNKKSYLITSENPGWRKNYLLFLFLGIYQPTKGEINIGNHSYNSFNTKKLRRFFAVVSNRLPIYGKTVFESVVYSMNETREKRAKKILDFLQLDIPDSEKIQLKTSLIENASNLSDQQRQIILFTRAFTTNKRNILIVEISKVLHYTFYPQLEKYLLELMAKGTRIIFLDKQINNSLFDETITI